MPEETAPAQEIARERGRPWFRVVIAALVTALIIMDIVLYSTVQTLRSRADGHDHRINRTNQMITDMIKANQNAEKIEKIETQVDVIGTQVTELSTTLKAEAEAKAAETPAAPKKRHRR